MLHSISHEETHPTSVITSRPRSTNSIKDIKVLKKTAYGNNLSKVSTSGQSITQDVKNIRKLKKQIKRTGLVLARHAEENALDRYKKLIDRTEAKYTTRKLHLTVIRINAKGELTESKPCSHCVSVLRDYGIRKITYSTKDGTLVTESLQTIISQPSVGYRSAERALQMLDEMLTFYGT